MKCVTLVSLKCHLLTEKAPRLSEKRSRACCQKINFVTDDWRGYGYLRVQTWAFFRKTFSSDGRMGPSTVPNPHETTLRFSKNVVDHFADLLARYLDSSIYVYRTGIEHLQTTVPLYRGPLHVTRLNV
jgi:hypothetical protein